MTIPGARTAVEWLVSVAPDPEASRRKWERNPLGVVLLPVGRSWDVLILPGELGQATLDVPGSWFRTPAGRPAGCAGWCSRTGRGPSPTRWCWSSRCTRRPRAGWRRRAGSLDKVIGLDHLGRR